MELYSVPTGLIFLLWCWLSLPIFRP